MMPAVYSPKSPLGSGFGGLLLQVPRARASNPSGHGALSCRLCLFLPFLPFLSPPRSLLMSLPTVELSGSFREQGRQHGEALAETIREIISEVLDPGAWEPEKVAWLFATVKQNLTAHAPGVLEELQGIAEGSGITYEDILAYNALADIWMVHKFCSATGWADGPQGPLVGKTNDIGRDQAKYHHPFRRRSGEGLAAVWATWPGTVWANCFVNGPGLAFGGASLGMDARNPVGVPSNCMLRLLMDRCGTIQEAVSLCERVPVMHHPAHLVLADVAGGLIALELAPQGPDVCQGPGEAAVCATNHFCPGPWEGRDSGEARHMENSRRRLVNLRRLAGALPHTVEGMTQLVRDHAPSGQICQHGNEDMWSSTAYVAAPRGRRMLIARGQPCETEFLELAL